VLDRQPPDLARFMLDTSILGELSAEASAAVTRRQDAGALLRAIDAAHLFLVALDEERGLPEHGHHRRAASQEVPNRPGGAAAARPVHRAADQRGPPGPDSAAAAARFPAYARRAPDRGWDAHPQAASGSTYPQIATTLFISRNTVKTHIRSIYQKLGVTSRLEAIERALELRLL
jgi:ATP/maltotriose-dependent transcriptional regulator MalT